MQGYSRRAGFLREIWTFILRVSCLGVGEFVKYPYFLLCLTIQIFLVEAYQKCIGFGGISFNIMVNWNGKKKKTYTFWNIIKLSHKEVRAGSHGDPSHMSQVWHGCLNDNTFWGWGLGLVLWVGSSQKLSSTLNPNLVNIFAWNNKDPTLMIVTNILVYFGGSKVETLPPCWDLLTWVELGTWDHVWTSS